MSKVELLNPVALTAVEVTKTEVHKQETLQGKTVGIMYAYVDWRGFKLFAARLKELLREKVGVKDVIEVKSIAASQGGAGDVLTEKETKQKVFSDLATRIDFLIVGAAF